MYSTCVLHFSQMFNVTTTNSFYMPSNNRVLQYQFRRVCIPFLFEFTFTTVFHDKIIVPREWVRNRPFSHSNKYIVSLLSRSYRPENQLNILRICFLLSLVCVLLYTLASPRPWPISIWKRLIIGSSGCHRELLWGVFLKKFNCPGRLRFV